MAIWPHLASGQIDSIMHSPQSDDIETIAERKDGRMTELAPIRGRRAHPLGHSASFGENRLSPVIRASGLPTPRRSARHSPTMLWSQPMAQQLPTATLYTDGGCRPNPGPGGWGAVLLLPDEPPRELSGGEDEATNNRMELRAAIEGLRVLDGPHRVELYTDSVYLRSGVTEWLPKWRAAGWRTAGKRAVKNQDLWQELERELDRHRVGWHWVKGHAGDRWNERADELAAAAMPRAPLPVDDPQAVHLFTAAAYSGRKGVGSWAVLLKYGGEEKLVSGRSVGTTANRMHLRAAVAGLRALKRRVRVHLYTTSDYLKDGATAWIAGWRARGWKTRDGKPVAHRDLWQELATAMTRHDLRCHVADRDHLPEEMKQAKSAAKQALAK
jgi:ribonuclease HI